MVVVAEWEAEERGAGSLISGREEAEERDVSSLFSSSDVSGPVGIEDGLGKGRKERERGPCKREKISNVDDDRGLSFGWKSTFVLGLIATRLSGP